MLEIYEKYNLYWADAHSNLHTFHLKDIEKLFSHAKKMIDFWPIAYYPYECYPHECGNAKGFPVELWLEKKQIEKDWNFLREFVTQNNQEGKIVLFMGYEWQGNGKDGDHNVFYLDNNQPLYRCARFSTLMKRLPKGRAIAIPHHTAYKVGQRGKNWDFHDEVLSPFAEIYSSHGSSEQDITEEPLYSNFHMGPSTSGGTIFDGLARGYKFGIIASGDNHPCPAIYGHGLMACYAEELTKKALWDSFLKRRVYGVSRDRIKLRYSLNGEMMGGVIESKPPFINVIEVEGGSSIHRIEIYRNNLLIADYTHTGKWEELPLKDKVRFKFKIEFGWGPDRRVYTDIGEKIWKGVLEVDGKIVSIEKCWKRLGQDIKREGKNRCHFTLTTSPPPPLITESFIFEVESSKNSSLLFQINGKKFIFKVGEILEHSHLIGFLEESKRLAYERWGFKKSYREDPFWHHAYKFKIHKGIPEQGYKVKFIHKEESKKKEVDYYMVKVIQKDGACAWSSPIWVK
ncbi:MAG TPA: hypothetical protein ENG68_02880 [bacterium]|nr:hypothetical protein [bacterium]